MDAIEIEEEHPRDKEETRGVGNYWARVNHIARVVSDVGRSVTFYTHVVGMSQVIRPDFDRHGAWLTMGNLDLHLIKGRPAVHLDDDLIVGHIALTIQNEQMEELQERLTTMGVQFRRNISVPVGKAAVTGGGKSTKQAFVRDPDGYYIEFCGCNGLENYLHDTQQVAEAKEKDFTSMFGLFAGLSAGKKMSTRIEKIHANIHSKVFSNSYESESPYWLLSDEDIKKKEAECKLIVNEAKLRNLLNRRKTYGDVCQEASEAQLRYLLMTNKNKVPFVIKALKMWAKKKGTQTHIPPAFYERDGTFYQPPSVEVPVYYETPGLS